MAKGFDILANHETLKLIASPQQSIDFKVHSATTTLDQNIHNLRPNPSSFPYHYANVCILKHILYAKYTFSILSIFFYWEWFMHIDIYHSICSTISFFISIKYMIYAWECRTIHDFKPKLAKTYLRLNINYRCFGHAYLLEHLIQRLSITNHKV